MNHQTIALALAKEVIKRNELSDDLPGAARDAARLYNEVLDAVSSKKPSSTALEIALTVIDKLEDDVELSPNEAATVYNEVHQLL